MGHLIFDEEFACFIYAKNIISIVIFTLSKIYFFYKTVFDVAREDHKEKSDGAQLLSSLHYKSLSSFQSSSN